MKSLYALLFLVSFIGVLFSGCGKKVETKITPITVVFFGDSVTYGYGISNPSDSFYGRIDAIMRAGVYDNIKTVNAGISGSSTDDALTRLSSVKTLNPDIVVVAFGLNDCQSEKIDPVRFRQNLIRITSSFPQTTKVILATSNSFMDTGQDLWKDLNASLERYMEEIRKLSRDKGLPLIDVHTAWKSQLRSDSRHMESMYIDPTHPSAIGHHLIFETYMNVLRKMLVR